LGPVTSPRRSNPLLALVLVVLVVTGTACTPTPSTPAPPTDPPGPTAPPTTLDIEVGRSDPVADPMYPDYGNGSLDVLAYQLQLAWDPDSRRLDATAALTIRAAEPVDRITLDFADSYTVDSVSVNGTAATSSWDGDDIVVPAALDTDARATLVVAYHGRPRPVDMPSGRGDFDEGVGLRSTPDGEAWTMQEPYGAATWYPANDMPSDEAVYDTSVTVPDGWAAVAHGQLVGVDEGGDTDTFRWQARDPVASYLATLAVAEYTRIDDTGPGGIPLTYWLRTGKDEAFEPIVRRTPELLSWLADRFGPYPFSSSGVVFVESESAMETQQMVTFGSELSPATDAEYVAEVLLHEYAHQWFGDAVTPTDWNGLWLNEGWAMYVEALWTIDQKFATDAEWVTYFRSADMRSRATAGPPGDAHPDHFGEENVYVGPALMLREIHRAIGDQAFFALGRDWVQSQRNEQVDRAEFVAFVNQHTGRDFTALIDTWLDSPTTPPTT
jgi:aminopeptidase N